MSRNHHHRHPCRRRVVAALAAIAALPAAGAVAGTATAAPTERASVDLELTLRTPGAPSGGVHWRIHCGPQDFARPGPCSQVVRPVVVQGLRALACEGASQTEYGGPQTLVISGTLRGLRVRTVVRRVNSCQSARWILLTTRLRPIRGPYAV